MTVYVILDEKKGHIERCPTYKRWIDAVIKANAMGEGFKVIEEDFVSPPYSTCRPWKMQRKCLGCAMCDAVLEARKQR